VELQGNKATLLAQARLVAREQAIDATSPQARTDVCLDLLDERGADRRVEGFRRALHSLPVDERHYWIGTLYTLMLPHKVRRSQATYFTPPAVADAVVDFAIDAGFNLERDDVLDPAAGGAAFLSTIAGRMAIAGLAAKDVAYRLNGIEIDVGLAALSRRLIADRLEAALPRDIILVGDALNVKIPAAYGLVIANPPYGRMSIEEVRGKAWRRVAHSGHINKYALFAELCFRHAKPGGVVALVIPSSFRAGPLYDRMRSFIRSRGEVLTIGSIAGRDGVFLDVAQDISVLIVRKGKAHPPNAKVRFPIVGIASPATPIVEQALPSQPDDAWPLPAIDPATVGGASLADYGVTARAGYFVWNREQSRLVPKLGRRRGYPLIWAKNVRSGVLCRPGGKKGTKTDFVTFTDDSAAVMQPDITLTDVVNDPQRKARYQANVGNLLDHLGVERLVLVRNLPICEFSFGYTRVSATPVYKREHQGTAVDMPVRLKAFDQLPVAGTKRPIYVTQQQNEALYFKLDEARVLRWLKANQITDVPEEGLGRAYLERYEDFGPFLEVFKDREGTGGYPRTAPAYVYLLLHTLSHQMMHSLADSSGVDRDGIGEHIFPADLAFVIYRKGMTPDLGNISAMWRNHADEFLRRAIDPRTLRCGSGSLCDARGGACPACVMVSEVSCIASNLLLSRAVLKGGKGPEWEPKSAPDLVGFFEAAVAK